MKLVPAAPRHVSAMASVHAQAFDQPWDETAFEDLLEGPGIFGFVAEGEDPAGLVLCRAMAGEAEILTIAVPPWARRRGVGAALMNAAIARARAAGASELFLEVDVANAPAVALYERLGFVRNGLRKGYYDRGPQGRADALVMRLDLTSQAL